MPRFTLRFYISEFVDTVILEGIEPAQSIHDNFLQFFNKQTLMENKIETLQICVSICSRLNIKVI